MPKDGLFFRLFYSILEILFLKIPSNPLDIQNVPRGEISSPRGTLWFFCGLFRLPDALLVDRGSLNTERVGQDVLISEGKKEEFRGFVFVFVKFHFHILLSFLRDSERSRDRLSRILHTLRGGEAGSTGLRRLSHPRSMPRDGRYPFVAPRFHPCR